jgi:hypothetical protein
MNARGRILIVAPSIDTCDLKTGPTVPVGYCLNELAGARGTRAFFTPDVVQDREVNTGQNRPSDHAIADLFVNRYSAAKAAA